MTSKIPNNEKILLVLKEFNCRITNKDLSDYTKINVKNIGKYLDKLSESKHISRKNEQVGQKRYMLNKILAKGKAYKFKHTYSELKIELNDTLKKEMIQVRDENIEVDTVQEAFDIADAVKQNEIVYLQSNERSNIKTEVLALIKILPIRDLDAQKIGLKNKQELTQKIISLILKL